MEVPLEFKNLPDSLIVDIFRSLDLKSVSSCSRVSRQMLRVSQDEQLWKFLICRDFKKEMRNSDASNAHKQSWKYLYRLLYFHSPQICCQTILEHSNEVMRITFSRNSELMASVSKDYSVCIWNFDQNRMQFELVNKFDTDMYTDSLMWAYPRYVQFNDTNSHVLVTAEGIPEVMETGAVFPVTEYPFSPAKSFQVSPTKMCAQWWDASFLLSAQMVPGSTTGTDITCFSIKDEETSRIFRINLPRKEVVASFQLLSRYIPESIIAENADPKEADYRLLLYSVSCAADSNSSVNYVSVNLVKRSKINEIVKAGHSDVGSLYCLGTVDCGGFIIGMKLSNDERFLAVSVRPTKQRDTEGSDMAQSGVALLWDSNVQTRILDLNTLTLLPQIYRGAVNPEGKIWYKYPDASPNFVASGSSDEFAYLWSRHSNTLLGTLAKLRHDGVGIDCAVFDPNDEEVLVTACDDHSIKVWVSRNKIAQRNAFLRSLY